MVVAVEPVVVVVEEFLVVEPLLEDGATVVPASLPCVTTNVTASTSTPSTAMIAGRGSSIRDAFGTVSGLGLGRRGLTAYSARNPLCLSASVPRRVEACYQL